MGLKQFQTTKFYVGGSSFRWGSWFQILVAVTEKAHLAILSLKWCRNCYRRLCK